MGLTWSRSTCSAAGRTHWLYPRKSSRRRSGTFDYLVSIHRFNRPKEFLVYPILLPERLPEIAYPSLPGDPDVPLDLQAIFSGAYDAGPFEREIEYGKDPIVPRLKPEQAEWAANLLKPDVAQCDDRDEARHESTLASALTQVAGA